LLVRVVCAAPAAMKLAATTLACVVATATGHKLNSGTPVERVVNLLKDLKEKLALDEKSEQQIYDKYACWCEKTTARKAADIVKAQNDLRSLGQTILTVKGRIATLVAEIEQLEAEIKANLDAQDKATAIRRKENTAFMEETAELKQAIAALQQAVTVLVDGTSLLQVSEATSAVRNVVEKLPSRASLKPEQEAHIAEFLQAAHGAKYMPQSLTIQGILTDMYDTFTGDLESAYQVESNANRNFEDFMFEKDQELRTARKEKAKREEEKSEKEAQLADTQQIYDDTAEQKAADIEFFDETKAGCLAKHEAWTTRSDLRQEEIAGIQEALEILTSDDARELFASAIKEGKETGASNSYDTGRDVSMSLLQLSSDDALAAPVSNAYNALKKQATTAHSLRLAALAVKVRTSKVGHFDAVVRAIDTMIQTLKEEDLADIAKRDQCKEEYLKIESTVKNVTWLIKNNDAKIEKLTKLIELRETQKAETIEQIADVEKLMQELTAQRTSENQEFLNDKDEDQRAIDLLMSARDAIARYYKRNNIEMGPLQGGVKDLAMVQQPEFDVSADQAPDAVFSGKGKRKNESKGVLQIIQMIVEDLNDEIKNSMKAEEAAQLEYEGQMKAAKQLRKELIAKKVSLEEAIATRTEEKTAEETDKTNNENDLEEERTYKASIQDDCDFIIRTFSKRASDRAAEMDGLVGAKEYLAGAMPKDDEAVLLDKGSVAFDDKALSNTRFLGLGR